MARERIEGTGTALSMHWGRRSALRREAHHHVPGPLAVSLSRIPCYKIRGTKEGSV